MTHEKKPVLFSNLLSQPYLEVPQNKPTLFGNILKSSPSKTPNTEKSEKPTLSIFGSLPKEGGIFGPVGKSIFDSVPRGGLFGNFNPTNNGGLFSLERFKSQDSGFFEVI